MGASSCADSNDGSDPDETFPGAIVKSSERLFQQTNAIYYYYFFVEPFAWDRCSVRKAAFE